MSKSMSKSTTQGANWLVRCRVCGCTEVDACPAGCSWVDDDLCSVCAAAAEALAEWLTSTRRMNREGLWREAEHWQEARQPGTTRVTPLGRAELRIAGFERGHIKLEPRFSLTRAQQRELDVARAALAARGKAAAP